jgi:tRNA modification GTPase
MFGRDDTIAAIASPPGRGLRGIVRISGPGTEPIWRTLCELPATDAGAAASVFPVSVRLPPPWPRINAWLFWWPGPRSYTRQPVAELHLPGSPPLLDAVLAAVCRAGARLAEPGEFTLRAFLSGRIDLTQAEAVLGVIDARGQRELEVALEQLAGGLAGPLHDLRHRLVHTLAELEAGLDFVEEDIEFVSAQQLHDRLAEGLSEVERLRSRLQSRLAAGGLPRVVLLGPPNAGKSSLWNALVGEPAALVADRPGTTRDYLERETSVDGQRCLIIDTAGIEAVGLDDPIGSAAQRATQTQGERAELRLVCREAVSSQQSPAGDSADDAADQDGSQLTVWTKVDQLATEPRNQAGEVWVSSLTGTGLDELRRRIADRLERLADAESAVVAGTAVRCQDSLRRAAESLARAVALAGLAAGFGRRPIASLGKNTPPEYGGEETHFVAEYRDGDERHSGDERRDGDEHHDLQSLLGFYGSHGRDEYIAAELRLALDGLGQVAGAVHSEDILDVVFSRFCIGK